MIFYLTGVITWLIIAFVVAYIVTYPILVTISVTVFRLRAAYVTSSGVMIRPFLRLTFKTLKLAYCGEDFHGYCIRSNETKRIFVHNSVFNWEDASK